MSSGAIFDFSKNCDTLAPRKVRAPNCPWGLSRLVRNKFSASLWTLAREPPWEEHSALRDLFYPLAFDPMGYWFDLFDFFTKVLLVWSCHFLMQLILVSSLNLWSMWDWLDPLAILPALFDVLVGLVIVRQSLVAGISKDTPVFIARSACVNWW